ncbi:MAG: glycosyltransferase family 1 protein [Flavobacteriaceae bacterium]
MKIAILADPLDNQNAGVHIYTKSLVNELLKRNDGHEYILVRQKKDPSLKNVQQIIIPNINLPIGYASFRLFFIIPLLLIKNKVDVVFEPAHFGPFNLLKKIKRITFIHDLTPIKFPEYHRWHSQILQKIFLKSILKKTNLILTNSKNTSLDLEYYYPFTKGKNKTILLGKESIYQPIQDIKLIQSLDVKPPYFLNVGTIEPRKNLLNLLSAYTLFVEQSNKPHTLVLAGGMGWKTEEFKEVLNNHPYRSKIILLGYVSKKILPTLYTHAEAFIYPSVYEGFGFPVLEALACGTDVICSNTSSLPEVGGKAANYCNPHSSIEIKDKMLKITNYTIQEKEYHRQKNLEQSKLFSWEKHVDIFINSINEMF